MIDWYIVRALRQAILSGALFFKRAEMFCSKVYISINNQYIIIISIQGLYHLSLNDITSSNIFCIYHLFYKYMRFINKFSFATNIAIISGSSKNDKVAASLIKNLKASSPHPINFVGVIGDQYKDLLHQCYSTSAVMDHEEIVVNRNYKQQTQQGYLNPYRTITHYKSNQLVQLLKRKNFYDNLISSKTSAVITVSTFSLMSRVFEQVNEAYQSSNLIKPLRIGFDSSIANRRIDNEEQIDYIYCNLPRLPENLGGYIFPSTCIGYSELFTAFQYLQKYKEDPSNDSFLYKEFSYEIGQLVNKARSQYRTANGISQDTYLTVLAPGNTSSQIKFSFQRFKDAIATFASKPNVSGIDQQFFKFAILLPEEEKLAAMIRSEASKLPTNYEITFVEERNKYGVMCAADFGLMHNGAITVEAAAFQLPITVISSMSNYKAYLTYMYNGHDSPLNVSTNYEGYQDLLGSLTAIGQKMATLMIDHFERPKLRFYYVKLYRDEIKKMLALNGRNPELRVSQTGHQWAAKDILEKVELYEGLNKSEKMRGYERKEKLHCA